MEMQARRPHKVRGKTAAPLNYNNAACESAGAAVIAIFPFCNMCARRKVWRDIMGADASAADPNIAADEHFLI